MIKRHQYMSEWLARQNKINQVMHFVRALCYQHACCEIHMHEQKLYPTEAWGTV